MTRSRAATACRPPALERSLRQTGDVPFQLHAPFFDHAANHTGRQVQAPQPLHDPENVVETLYRLVLDPKDRKIVGRDGVVKILMKEVAPGLAERRSARKMHELQMEKAPPAKESSGAVLSPMAGGTGVSAGRNAP